MRLFLGGLCGGAALYLAFSAGEMGLVGWPLAAALALALLLNLACVLLCIFWAVAVSVDAIAKLTLKPPSWGGSSLT